MRCVASATEPVFRYALTSLRANLTRLASTALAVVIGITFLSAGLLLTDAMRAGLTGDVEEQYESVDLALVARSSEGGFGLLQTIPADTLELARSTDGVAAAAGEILADARVLRDDGSSVSLRSQGRAWIDDEALNPLTLRHGVRPRRRGRRRARPLVSPAMPGSASVTPCASRHQRASARRR